MVRAPRGLLCVVLSAVCLLAADGALDAQGWRGPEDLEVRVEDAKGKPVGGAEVVLDFASNDLGGPAPLLTDVKGHVAIGGLTPGRWALEVRKPGFMSFRAEIALSGGEKPAIVAASQHNVPGAVSTMRVRIARARSAPPAPARVERVSAAPQAPPSRAPEISPAPAPPEAAPVPQAREVAPAAPPAAVASAPAPAAPPATVVSAPAPAAAQPTAPKPATPEPSAPEATRAPSAPPAAVASPLEAPAAITEAAAPTPPAPLAPTAAAPPSSEPPPAPEPNRAPASVPSAPPRIQPAAPIARACYECRPGESALLAEAELAAGGALCPADLAGRLGETPRDQLQELAAALPAGCVVLTVELPPNARYSGFRYEAAGSNGRSEDCLAGRSCPAGACRFPIEPVVRREGDSTIVLALFESEAARRAGFTVYWRRTR